MTVVIPCGKCIVMDEHDGIVELIGGLDIQGKFVVPDGVTLRIRTTHILVQGELHMESTKPINGKSDIQITWIGSRSPISFHAVNNTKACGGRLGK